MRKYIEIVEYYMNEAGNSRHKSNVQGILPQFIKHLGKMLAFDEAQSWEHWRSETDAWLRSIRNSCVYSGKNSVSYKQFNKIVNDSPKIRKSITEMVEFLEHVKYNSGYMEDLDYHKIEHFKSFLLNNLADFIYQNDGDVYELFSLFAE